MAKKTISLSSILGGIQTAQYFVAPGQYHGGVGIDPDLPASDAPGDSLPSGLIRPSGYAKFSSTNVTSPPIAIVTNPKDAKIYVILKNGRLVRYDSDYTNETLIGTVAGGNAEGAFYYNNYVYITGTGASSDDMSRYGPLNNSPTLVDNVWKGATLGSLTALNATTMPTLRNGLAYPAHWGFVHSNGAAYVLDFKNGQGLVHKIKTTKVTNEGDTNDGSAYNVLDLPFGFIPFAGCSIGGNDVAILAAPTTDGVTFQGKAEMFIWDVTDTVSFYERIPIPDALATAIINNNGQIYVLSGPSSGNGHSLSRWLGGRTLETLKVMGNGCSPMPGAVDAVRDRVVWGTFDILPTEGSPEYYAVVKAYGSKDPGIPPGLHNVANASVATTSTDGVVTALKVAQQASLASPKFIIGWKNATAWGLDKQGTTYGTCVWRSPLIQVGQKFTIEGLRFPLATAVAANMTITPKVYLDDFSSASTDGLAVINSTNYPDSDRFVDQKPAISGKNNFVIELRFTGTALATAAIPINITLEVEGD